MIEIRTVGDLAALMDRIREENERLENARDTSSLRQETAWEQWNAFSGEEIEFNPLGINHA